MSELRNKTILILSPQAWGKMFLSKHHYAIELAKRGNKVFFLNPPDQTSAKRKQAVEIKASGIHPNLWMIEHQLFFPYVLKFKAVGIFHWLMGFHVKKLLREINVPIDIVWSFDLVNLYPLRFFGNAYKIFHPVDEPLTRESIAAAKGAEIIFSVTTEIIEKYHAYRVPKHFINHGVLEEFIAAETQSFRGQPIRVGFSGNLLRGDIDRTVLLQIIRENELCIFEFWGSFSQAQGNIGGVEDDDVKSFVQALRTSPNVVLHGAVSPAALAEELKRMDAFLICYDVKRDQSRGTNYHKVMEYVATGKVIVSNNITTYKNLPDLVQAVASRDNNAALPDLFKKVMANLQVYNSADMVQKRIAFAQDNTYSAQITRIEQLIHL